MLWIDMIDMLFLISGIALGYILCYIQHRDILHDECDDCLYRKYIEEDIKNVREQENIMGI